jgi:CRP/FNR family transcriptional regulator
MDKVSVKQILQGEADCRLCVMRSSVLFAGLDETECQTLVKAIDHVVLAPQAVLYRAGDPAHSVFTIRSGLVKLVQYLPDGRQRIVRLLRGTDCTGLEALLGQPYQHDAIALQPTEICRIPLDVVLRLERQNPRLHQEVLTRWQRALVEADAWLTQLSTGSARARTARLLLRLASGDDACDLFSREDMGAMLGITTETASRIIAEFKRSGVLKELRNGTLRCDLAALNKIAAD